MILKKLSIAVFAILVATSSAWASAPQVAVSIKPVHSLVAALMKGVGEPRLLVTGKNTPLDFSMTEKQAAGLAKNDLVVWMGPELEAFLVAPLKTLPKRVKVLEMLSSDEFKILNARWDENKRNPYLWLDVRNAEVFVDVLHNALVSVDPRNAGKYNKNRKDLKLNVARLDRVFEYGFRAIAAGKAWAYHDTQQYFEQSYALRIQEFLAPEPGQSAEMANLLKARTSLAGKGKTCLFTEAGLTSEKLSFVSEGAQIVVAELDSFATKFKPGPKLYEDLMSFNFNTIANCFAGIDAKYGGPLVKRPNPGWEK